MGKFGRELIESAHEAVAIAQGRSKPARRFDIEAVDVSAIRRRMNLSQAKFAERFGLSVATVRDWEQGRGGFVGIPRTGLIIAFEHIEMADTAVSSGGENRPVAVKTALRYASLLFEIRQY